MTPSTLAHTLSALKSGQLDLLSHLDALCDRIEAVDPHLHCFVEEPDRRARLRVDAERLLQAFPRSDDRPSLFGLAMGVKDIYRADGFDTRCGSALPPALFAGSESGLVTRLKSAGALIVGKTVTTEFAWFEPGPTRNPLNPEHTPGGSSSGSAAAVAAQLAHAALGTQTIGSIIRPAAYCGITGVKPSAGSLPTDGIIPFSKTFDHPGFFTQDLESAEHLAAVICDEWQVPHPPKTGKPVIGLPDNAFLEQADTTIQQTFENQVKKLADAGFTIIKTKMINNIDQINEYHKALAAKEFSDVHEEWFETYGHLYGKHSIDLVHTGRKVSTGMVREILQLREKATLEVASLMDSEGIDCWLSPSATSLPPKGLESTGSPLMNLPWTFTGLPCISIPVQSRINSSPLPFPAGLQLSGKANGLKPLFAHTSGIQKHCS